MQSISTFFIILDDDDWLEIAGQDKENRVLMRGGLIVLSKDGQGWIFWGEILVLTEGVNHWAFWRYNEHSVQRPKVEPAWVVQATERRRPELSEQAGEWEETQADRHKTCVRCLIGHAGRGLYFGRNRRPLECEYRSDLIWLLFEWNHWGVLYWGRVQGERIKALRPVNQRLTQARDDVARPSRFLKELESWP